MSNTEPSLYFSTSGPYVLYEVDVHACVNENKKYSGLNPSIRSEGKCCLLCGIGLPCN